MYLHSSIDYIYLLFWNSIWTLAPVIGIGLFDRILGNTHYLCVSCLPSDGWTDAKLLMDLPELYHYGRRGTWFNMRSFLIYMFDGFLQVRARSHWFYRSNLHMSRLQLSISSFFTRTHQRHLVRTAMTCIFTSSRRYAPFQLRSSC